MLGNRGFLLFAGSMLAYSVLVSQMYLALPLEVRRVSGSDAGIGALFVMSSPGAHIPRSAAPDSPVSAPPCL